MLEKMTLTSYIMPLLEKEISIYNYWAQDLAHFKSKFWLESYPNIPARRIIFSDSYCHLSPQGKQKHPNMYFIFKSKWHPQNFTNQRE